MRIDNNYSPNFGANLINRTNISKIIQNSSLFRDEIASFVKIDVNNEGDIKALKDTAKYWANSNFTTNIYHAACAMKNDSKYYKYNNIYALTTQKSDYENLNSDDILGLVHVSPLEDGGMFLEHLEAKPEIVLSATREIKGIGTAILNSLKMLTHKIICFPSSTKTVKNFYYKNGFIEYMEPSNLFVWFKEI